jgi:hypothetical protein
MSEEKFTSGPWQWDGDELIASGGFPVLTAGLARNGGRYVSVKDDDKPILAASPDLYEALIDARAAMEIWAPDADFSVIDAALAKARGETP